MFLKSAKCEASSPQFHVIVIRLSLKRKIVVRVQLPYVYKTKLICLIFPILLDVCSNGSTVMEGSYTKIPNWQISAISKPGLVDLSLDYMKC